MALAQGGPSYCYKDPKQIKAKNRGSMYTHAGEYRESDGPGWATTEQKGRGTLSRRGKGCTVSGNHDEKHSFRFHPGIPRRAQGDARADGREPFPVFPWERRFVRGSFQDHVIEGLGKRSAALFGVLSPLGRKVEAELRAKLDDGVSINWDELRASDLSAVGRVQSWCPGDGGDGRYASGQHRGVDGTGLARIASQRPLPCGGLRVVSGTTLAPCHMEILAPQVDLELATDMP